ncbi:MAG: hypothetical protein U9P42_05805 [Candidatus Fermentibacteria bacterium]|nr:hypothetical protein [Candidatus Fermentibacteria bacterium]
MKRITAILLLVLFSNMAVAHPFASGGGESSSSEETDLTMIILVVVVAGVGALLLADILADDSTDSHDALSGGEEEILNEETGVNWEQLNSSEEQEALPLVAVSIFPGENGRALAAYFSNLIVQGNGLYYDVYSAPVAFGEMSSAEAAATGFSFLDCQWFIATASSGLELHSENSEDPIWFFNSTEWDSTTVREASASFLEFSMGSDL